MQRNLEKIDMSFTTHLRWYRYRMEEYLSDSAILVLVKSIDRSERIDIKPAILSYEMHITSQSIYRSPIL